MSLHHHYFENRDPQLSDGVLLASLRDWWNEPGGPGFDYSDTGHVLLDLNPGDMTSYRMIVTDLRASGFPGRPTVAVALLNVSRRLADFRAIELTPDGNPMPHEATYIRDKLEMSPHPTGPLVIAQIAGLASR
jgi:hypothetical protein